VVSVVALDREALRRRALAAAGAVVDPEIPVLTIADLGVLRDARVLPDGTVEVDITPTYSGCPAMTMIALQVEAALLESGLAPVRVRTVLHPAWTTDWMTERGREALRDYGIAPPGPRVAAGGPGFVELSNRPYRAETASRDDTVPGDSRTRVPCPHCGSERTRMVSRFSSTACKALYSCDACLEPFDYFKAL
jgi:ring-1,2-phenylacetyl-CoA epoxidase subunit PaaD